MALLDTIKSGDRITFSLVKAGIAGDTYKNVLVDSGASGFSTARRASPDIATKHANLYPFFKDKVNNVNDATAYRYIIIKPNDLKEDVIAIGIPWINEDSIRISDTQNVGVELFNFEEYKRPALETALKNLGLDYNFTEKKS